jgi:hypothetical protein
MAAGYAPGEYDAAQETYTVRESAAHTWPEVYFPGFGWIEFEPTPSQPAVQQGQLEALPTVETTPGPPVDPDLPDVDRAGARNLDDQSQLGGGGGFGATTGGRALGVGLLLMFAAAFVLVMSGRWVVLPWLRRRAAAGNASEYYGRMLRWARLLGIGPAAYQTPYEFSESVAREVPGTSLFTRSIARAYVRERFGRAELEASDRLSILRAWDSLRGRFVRALPARQLKRAYRRKKV